MNTLRPKFLRFFTRQENRKLVILPYRLVLVDPEGIEPNRLATQHIKATDLQSAVGNRIQNYLVRVGSFEIPTLWLKARYSASELHPHGAPGGI